MNHNNSPFIFPKDKLRTFSPTVLFHEHTYKNTSNSYESIRIDQNDKHHGEFLKLKKKNIENMLRENSRFWLSIFALSKEYEYEKNLMEYNEMINCTRPAINTSPIQLANTIYSHHPTHSQDQMEQKPKRRRGNLPKATTALLKEWLAQHKKHPYPTEEEKVHLARETRLTLQQISNWFINARRRHLPHLLESSDFKVTGSSQNPDLDIYPYEASDNSAEDSDNNGLPRRHAQKCASRINKSGGVKKLYARNKRKMPNA